MQDEKQLMFIELRRLYSEIGEPTRYDWVIHTDLAWWKYFTYWGNFVEESGILSEDGRSRYKRGPSKVTVEKLCETLRVVEERLGRPATPEDWYLLVERMSNHIKMQRYFRFFGMMGTLSQKKTTRWDLEKYVEHYENLARAGFYNNRLGWINFRYAAGLDNYSWQELINLGIRLIKPLMASSETDAYFIDAVELLDLSHLAIYDYFGTFEEYLKALDDYSADGEEPLSDFYNAPTEEVKDEDDEKSIEELLSSMKEIVKKLHEKGLNVKVTMEIL